MRSAWNIVSGGNPLALLTILFLPAFAACSNEVNGPQKKSSEKAARPGTEVSLTLTGYNYTDRYIDQFSVQGNEGGNLHVSSPSGGGGGSVCCIAFIAGVKTWKVPVRWQTGGCTFNTRRNSDGRLRSQIHHIFKEVVVQVEPSFPQQPTYLEIHIYPGERVEASVTDKSSMPRLKLPETREDKTPYPQCPNDKRPEDSRGGDKIARGLRQPDDKLRQAAQGSETSPVAPIQKPRSEVELVQARFFN